MEQKNLKSKITLQERILEGHLNNIGEEPPSGQTSKRDSSREFKIRKSSKGSIMMNAKKQSKEHIMSP